MMTLPEAAKSLPRKERTMTDWADQRDTDHPVRVEFVGGDPDGWLGIEAALDRINPIDRDLARSALLDGAPFRTFGAWYRYEPREGVLSAKLAREKAPR